MALNRDALRLYLVTDPVLCADLGVIETVQRAVAGGARMIQLRDKHASTAERVFLARGLMTALKGTDVPLIVNDDLEAAIASGADGAHIGQGDGDPDRARAMLGPDRILGRSCETIQTVEAASAMPVDYLGLGPVFATSTKADHKTPTGIDDLAAMIAKTQLPTVAIGGLNATHVPDVMAAGADGLAVVSAICGQRDPTQSAAFFYSAQNEGAL